MAVTTTVEHVVDIDARPDVVYGLWTTSEGLAAWWGDPATVVAKVGGDVRVQVDPDHVMVGEYLALDAPHRVSFSFGWEDGEPPPGATTVEVSIEPTSTGSRVTVRHSGLPIDRVEAHVRGWVHFLGDRLGGGIG